jgi:hypothetical protein
MPRAITPAGDHRPARIATGLGDRRGHCVEIMAVDLDDVPVGHPEPSKVERFVGWLRREVGKSSAGERGRVRGR